MAKTQTFGAAEYLNAPEAVAAYLSEALETGDDRVIAQARGTMASVKRMKTVAKEARVSRENLYRALTAGGRPKLAR